MDGEWLQKELHVRLKLKAVQIRHKGDVAVDGSIQDHVANGPHAAREKLTKIVEPAVAHTMASSLHLPLLSFS